MPIHEPQNNDHAIDQLFSDATQVNDLLAEIRGGLPVGELPIVDAIFSDPEQLAAMFPGTQRVSLPSFPPSFQIEPRTDDMVAAWKRGERTASTQAWMRIIGCTRDILKKNRISLLEVGIYQCQEDVRGRLAKLFSKLHDDDAATLVTPDDRDVAVTGYEKGILAWSDDLSSQELQESLAVECEEGDIEPLTDHLALIRNTQALERPEPPFVHIPHPLQYEVNEESIRINMPRPRMLPDGEAVKDLLDQELHLQEIWHNVCALLHINMPLHTLQVYVNDGNPAAMRHVTNFTWSHQSPRLKISSIRAAAYDALQLPLHAMLERRDIAEAILVHELGHVLSARMPFNALLIEGIAEALVRVYAKKYKKDWPDMFTKYQVLSGDRNGGFNLGDGARTEKLGQYHPIIGWTGATMLLDALGDSDEDREKHLRRLFTLSFPTSLGNVPGNPFEIRELPTVKEWLRLADQEIPGFEERLRNHHAYQPAASGPRTVWFSEAAPSHSRVSPHGMLAHFDLQPNANFGYTKPRPSHVEPRIEEFDLQPGSFKGLPIKIGIKANNVTLDSPASLCFMRLNPLSIATWVAAQKGDYDLFHTAAVEVVEESVRYGIDWSIEGVISTPDIPKGGFEQSPIQVDEENASKIPGILSAARSL